MATLQQTKPLPLVFFALGALACVWFTGMGMLYITNGNYMSAALAAIGSAVVLAVLSYYMERHKSQKIKSTGPKPSKKPERILFAMYAMAGIILMIVHFHYLFIDFTQKEGIKRSAQAKMNNLENLRTTYGEAIADSLQQLESSAETLKNTYWTPGQQTQSNKAAVEEMLGAGVTEFNQGRGKFDETFAEAVSAEKDRMAGRMMPKSLDSLNRKAKAFLSWARGVFSDWQTLKIANTYRQIDELTGSYLATAQTIVPGFNPALPEVTTYTLTSPRDSLSHASIVSVLICLVLTLILHLCILAPYIAAKRTQGALTENRVIYDNTGSLRASKAE